VEKGLRGVARSGIKTQISSFGSEVKLQLARTGSQGKTQNADSAWWGSAPRKGADPLEEDELMCAIIFSVDKNGGGKYGRLPPLKEINKSQWGHREGENSQKGATR